MAAGLGLIWIWILLMNSDAASAEVITAPSGGSVLMTFDLGLSGRPDVRWTHPNLVMSLKNNKMRYDDGRCELLSNGSLRFSRVEAADAGNYTVQVFDEDGKRLMKKDFELRVDRESRTPGTERPTDSAEINSSVSAGSSRALVSVMICCLLLLLPPFILIFIMRRRRRRRRNESIRTAGPLEENIYVTMHGNHGNNRKDEEKQEREEESPYVPFIPLVTMETPVTDQMSADAEDIYV